jgi:hypothetical protein
VQFLNSVKFHPRRWVSLQNPEAPRIQPERCDHSYKNVCAMIEHDKWCPSALLSLSHTSGIADPLQSCAGDCVAGLWQAQDGEQPSRLEPCKQVPSCGKPRLKGLTGTSQEDRSIRTSEVWRGDKLMKCDPGRPALIVGGR